MKDIEKATKQPNKKKPRKKRLKKTVRALRASIYLLIAAVIVAGVMLMVRQETIEPELAYEAPPPRSEAEKEPSAQPARTPSPEAEAEADFEEDVETSGTSGSPARTPRPSSGTSGTEEDAPAQRTPRPDAVYEIFFTKPEYSCDVYEVGLDKNDNIGTLRSANRAAWYFRSAPPGVKGNCIINGHQAWSKKKGVFAYLKEIELGEEVVLKDKETGAYFYYAVESVEEYPYDDYPEELLYISGEERLTLITCLGDYDRSLRGSRTRVVAVCKPA